jgi:hypothetical protein
MGPWCQSDVRDSALAGGSWGRWRGTWSGGKGLLCPGCYPSFSFRGTGRGLFGDKKQRERCNATTVSGVRRGWLLQYQEHAEELASKSQGLFCCSTVLATMLVQLSVGGTKNSA